MSILKTIARALGGTVGLWLKNELDKALMSAADKVAAKYGKDAKQLVIDAASTELSNSEKLFRVATDLVRIVAVLCSKCTKRIAPASSGGGACHRLECGA